MRKPRAPAPLQVRPELRARLTEREQEVLELFLLHPHDKWIAGKLNLKASTVRSHLASIQRKLGVKSREELVILLLSGDERNKIGNSSK